MELVITKIFEIQGHVMQKFGFIPDDAGFDGFANSLQAAEEADSEVKALGQKFKDEMKKLNPKTKALVEEDDDEECDFNEKDDAENPEVVIPN